MYKISLCLILSSSKDNFSCSRGVFWVETAGELADVPIRGEPVRGEPEPEARRGEPIRKSELTAPAREGLDKEEGGVVIKFSLPVAYFLHRGKIAQKSTRAGRLQTSLRKINIFNDIKLQML